jgi:hypothetical protein
MIVMADAKEHRGSRWTARILSLLLFLLLAAPAQAHGRLENRAGENSAPNACSCFVSTHETLELQRGKTAAARSDVPGDSFAPKSATARLTARADEVQSVLKHPAELNGRTAAVLETSGGDIVGGGVRDLSPAQRAALKPGEIASKLPHEHAEITVLQEAAARGLKPKAIGTSRDFCPDCIKALEEAGATITGPRTAVWK